MPTISGSAPRWRLSPLGAIAATVLLTMSAGSTALAAEYTDVTPQLVPKADLPLAPETEVNVSYAPEVPPASGRSEAAIVEVAFEVVENVTAIDPATGVEYLTWGYRLPGDEGEVSGTPGPMIRARVGDVLRFTITNPEGNEMPHNVDFHAVTGQGGGAAHTVVAPGMSATIEARLLYPGMFMYHCAMGDVPEHIAKGMYGGILVDPAEPLPAVDHEWYIVQSEYYTTGTEPGLVETDRAAVTAEQPTMVVFNGAKGALMGAGAPTMQVGERARIYFINAGLNLVSSFHPIGSHWDVVYPEAALLNEPLRGSQTTLVPAGGGTVVELVGQVPSSITLVDHALARAFDKGALGSIIVQGEENPEIYEPILAE
jgi:nitrite reductase (NO-forming)